MGPGGIINPDEAFLQVSEAQRFGEANAKKVRQKCFEQHWESWLAQNINILSEPEYNVLRPAAAL